MEEICVLIAKNQQRGLKKFVYERKTFGELNATLNIYTINGNKSIFTERRIRKICLKYKYIYSSCPQFFRYCKIKTESLINYLPCLSLTKVMNFIRFNPAKENIGLVIKSNKFVNINLLSRLFRNVKYICSYNSEYDDLIMQATGICPVRGKKLRERLIVYLDDNIYFLADGKLIYDIKVSLPDFLQSLKDIPKDIILCDCLKVEQGENLVKNLGLNMSDLVYT